MRRSLLHLALLPLATLALAACSDKSDGSADSATATDDTSQSTDDTSSTGDDTASGEVTWHADVSPMLQTHCARCHYEGGLGTGDFTDYATASAMAEIMLGQIDAGAMPPPASDPGCRDYTGSDHISMPDATRETLASWIDAGTPEGDPASAVTVEPLSEALSDPDLTLTPSAPYSPTFSDASNPGNEYRCFVLDHGQTEDFYITALQPAVDARAMMHHAVLYTVDPDRLSPQHTDPAGFDCINGAEFAVIDGIVHGWAPGSLPLELPEGVGIKIRADQQLMVQNHYFDPGTLDADPADMSGYDFRIAASVQTEAELWTLGVERFEIPAGEEAYSRSDSTRIPSVVDATLYSVLPHMHVLGSRYRMWYEDPDGVEHCLLDADGYDFENQLQYTFSDPVVIPGGSTVHYECTWNNSTSNPDLIHDPPVATGYGERTDEEMCFFFSTLSY